MNSESKKIRAWRESVGLSVNKLAELTGYSDTAIYFFEKGEVPPSRLSRASKTGDKQHSAAAWRRYKRACHSVDVELKEQAAKLATGRQALTEAQS